MSGSSSFNHATGTNYLCKRGHRTPDKENFRVEVVSLGANSILYFLKTRCGMTSV